MTKAKLKETGKWVREQQSPEAWKAERDIWAIGVVVAALLTWVDIHPPEGLTLALSYLIIRLVQLRARRRDK